jgi:2-oxoglutarate ferredoxin oxidoreductase subunit gamma
VVSDKEIASPVASSPEFVVAMNYPSMIKYRNMVKTGGSMFLNSDLISETPQRNDVRVVLVPANSLAHEMGNDRGLNMIMLGAVVAETGIVAAESLEDAVQTVLQGKKQSLIDMNRQALLRGAQYISSGK